MSFYVVVVSTHTTIAKAIRFLFKYKYNHAMISPTEDLREMFSFGRLGLKAPLIGGAKKENLYTLSLGKMLPIDCRIYRIDSTQEQYDLILEYIDKVFSDPEGYYYNIIGSLAILCKKKATRYKSYICSEFVAEAFKYAGIPLTTKDCCLVSPKDICTSLGDNFIYEGDISRYPYLSKDSSMYDDSILIRKDKKFHKRLTDTIIHIIFLTKRHRKSKKGGC